MSEEFIFNAFIKLEPVQRSQNRCNTRKFVSLNHSMCKRVLNLLEAIYSRLRKIVVERVTVVKIGVEDTGSDDNVCLRIKVRAVAMEFTGIRIDYIESAEI